MPKSRPYGRESPNDEYQHVAAITRPDKDRENPYGRGRAYAVKFYIWGMFDLTDKQNREWIQRTARN